MTDKCIGICKLDIDGEKCIGCGRKIEEIEDSTDIN
jgi:predicted Fe-S protein YdhL (DUF1289 family)